MTINPYSIAPSISALLILSTAIVVFMMNRSARVNRIFTLFCLSLFGWLFCYIIMYNQQTSSSAIFWARVGICFVVFMPILGLHFISSFLRMNCGAVLKGLYLIAPVGVMVGWTDYIYSDIGWYFWGPYPIAGRFYIIFLLMFAIIFSSNLFLLFWGIKRAEKDKRFIYAQQLRYLFIAFLCGSTGLNDYLIKFKLNSYPFGYISAFFFISIIAYAIARYRLMDIRVAISSAGIFLAVYSLTLGMPFYFYWKGFHLASLLSAIALGTPAPFIYSRLQKRAEDRILFEQRMYQETLHQAAAGMGRIRDLNKLLNLIVSIMTRSVRMHHAFIYFLDPVRKEYVLSAHRRAKSDGSAVKECLDPDSPIVARFLADPSPLVPEELRQAAQHSADKELAVLINEFTAFGAELVFPIFIRTGLVAVVIMGAKEKGKLYGGEDITVFSILANQASLAIENALFFENMQQTQEQLFRAEKLATIGTMADGLSHQVNNRFHALGFIAGDLLDTIVQYEKDPSRFILPDVLDQLRTGLKRMEDNVTQGGQVVRGLLDYSRNTKTEKGPVDLKKLLSASLDMVGLKIQLGDFQRTVDFPDEIPPVDGNFVQLQEVFFNIIDNAHHSMMEKKQAGREAGYQPAITFSAKAVDTKIHITITDNGMGIKPEDLRKLFTPFFTTKVSSRKGNGLGLFVIRKIIEEDHGGQIKLSSEYEKSASIHIVLPAYQGERSDRGTFRG